jgi:hypothetical protein
MNTPMSLSAARGRMLPFLEKEKSEEESETLESSLLQLIDDNRRSSLQLREKNRYVNRPIPQLILIQIIENEKVRFTETQNGKQRDRERKQSGTRRERRIC